MVCIACTAYQLLIIFLQLLRMQELIQTQKIMDNERKQVVLEILATYVVNKSFIAP